MRIGAEMLLQEYGPTHLDVAEALLEGKITRWQEFIDDIVTPAILDAAERRLRARQPRLPDLTPQSEAIDAEFQPTPSAPSKLLPKE